MAEINEIISKKIDDSDCDKPIKEFLNKMMFFQLQSISEGSGRWKFGKEFENMLKEGVAKRRGIKK